MRIYNATRYDLSFLPSAVRREFGIGCEVVKFVIKIPSRVIAHDLLHLFPEGILVVDVDIYEPGMNFVFGIADRAMQKAVVSVWRLKGGRFEKRVETEVLHELGHLMGLGHCAYPCVMAFSNSVNEVDMKRPHLCANCRKKLNMH